MDQRGLSNFKLIVHDKIKENSYLISPDGIVYSKLRKRILTPTLDKDGYAEIALQGRNGKRYTARVHKLVALAYIGECPDNILNPTINHIDENRLNNHYSNLEWMDASDNLRIRSWKPKGTLNGSSILNDDDVRLICERLSNNESYQSIANDFGVSKSSINNIKRRKTWTYISKDYEF